jgi:hypothetical protein
MVFGESSVEPQGRQSPQPISRHPFALFALLFVLVPNSQQEAKPLPVIITMLVMASIFGLISVCFFVVGFQLVVLKSGNGPSIGVHIPSSNYPGTQNLLSPRNQTEPLSTRQESTIWNVKGHCTFVGALLTYRLLSSEAFSKYIEIQARI